MDKYQSNPAIGYFQCLHALSFIDAVMVMLSLSYAITIAVWLKSNDLDSGNPSFLFLYLIQQEVKFQPHLHSRQV